MLKWAISFLLALTLCLAFANAQSNANDLQALEAGTLPAGKEVALTQQVTLQNGAVIQPAAGQQGVISTTKEGYYNVKGAANIDSTYFSNALVNINKNEGYISGTCSNNCQVGGQQFPAGAQFTYYKNGNYIALQPADPISKNQNAAFADTPNGRVLITPTKGILKVPAEGFASQGGYISLTSGAFVEVSNVQGKYTTSKYLIDSTSLDDVKVSGIGNPNGKITIEGKASLTRTVKTSPWLGDYQFKNEAGKTEFVQGTKSFIWDSKNNLITSAEGFKKTSQTSGGEQVKIAFDNGGILYDDYLPNPPSDAKNNYAYATKGEEYTTQVFVGDVSYKEGEFEYKGREGAATKITYDNTGARKELSSEISSAKEPVIVRDGREFVVTPTKEKVPTASLFNNQLPSLDSQSFTSDSGKTITKNFEDGTAVTYSENNLESKPVMLAHHIRIPQTRELIVVETEEGRLGFDSKDTMLDGVTDISVGAAQAVIGLRSGSIFGTAGAYSGLQHIFYGLDTLLIGKQPPNMNTP